MGVSWVLYKRSEWIVGGGLAPDCPPTNLAAGCGLRRSHTHQTSQTYIWSTSRSRDEDMEERTIIFYRGTCGQIEVAQKPRFGIDLINIV